eukprot:SAG11_NODE_3964_length_2130_cov_9.748400_2_plen_124_part_00
MKVNEEWSQQHSDAVARIKTAMTTYPILRQHDPKRQLHLVTDASDLAIGLCIYQYDGDSPYAIAYTSRSLIAAELNYTVQEKECLGVVHGVQKFRHYLLATPFQVEILTDHKSLQHCLGTSTS